MDYYNYTDKNIYVGNGYQKEVIYGDGVITDMLASVSKNLFKKAVETGTKVAQEKGLELAGKAGTKLAEKAISGIEDKVLGKLNKEDEENKPRRNATKGEVLASRKRIADIMKAERSRLMDNSKTKPKTKNKSEDDFLNDLVGGGLVQLGRRK